MHLNSHMTTVWIATFFEIAMLCAIRGVSLSYVSENLTWQVVFQIGRILQTRLWLVSLAYFRELYRFVA